VPDKKWFKKTGRNLRIRRSHHEGELKLGNVTLVLQIRPGIRFRFTFRMQPWEWHRYKCLGDEGLRQVLSSHPSWPKLKADMLFVARLIDAGVTVYFGEDGGDELAG
jgi:hypothetical protein